MNSAQRLHDLFLQAKAHRSDTHAYTVWLRIFELQDEPVEEHEDIGMACVIAVREELDILRETLRNHEVPEDLYNNAITTLRSLTSPAQFNANWMHLADRIGSDCLMMLKWASWSLESEEEPIPGEDRSKLLRDIESMVEELGQSTVPPFTKQLMLRYLGALRRALLSYKIRGVEPLNAALHETVGALRTQSGRLEADSASASPEAKGFIAKAFGVISKAADYADKAQKIQKGIDAGFQIAHHVHSLWSQLPNFPSLPGASG